MSKLHPLKPYNLRSRHSKSVMDSVVKHLRDGRTPEESSSCPFVVVFDDLSTIGSSAVIRQLANGLSSAITASRAQSRRILVVSFEGGQVLVEGGHVMLMDARMVGMSDWACSKGGNQAHTLEELHASINSLLCQSEAPSAIVIDSLSHPLTLYPQDRVLSFLHSLAHCSSVSCILAAIHTDLHQPRITASIEHLSSCSILLRPLDPLQHEVAKHLPLPPHGCISLRFNRRSGRVRAENQLYTLMASGCINCSNPPPAMASVTAESLLNLSLAPRKDAQSSNTSPGPQSSLDIGHQSSGVSSAPAMTAGGMNLGLTREERRAKEQVKMPFEHQGEGKALYNTGDFRDYLPRAAGGVSSKHQHQIDHRMRNDEDKEGGEVMRLGHINYIRDSESEGYSDEDPDDDLDI